MDILSLIPIDWIGHRKYVGGVWEKGGLSQFLFLLGRGLKPEHYFLDIGCGALRGGTHFIEYLQPEHYLGLEKELVLVARGIRQELGSDLFNTRRPQIEITKDFNFMHFQNSPDFALAHSVFTHLIPEDISRCLKNLRAFSKPETKFYATFFIAYSKHNPKRSHDHKAFYYSLEDIEHFANKTGWKVMEVDGWKHPKGQKMLEFKPGINRL